MLCLFGGYSFVHEIMPQQGMLQKMDQDPDLFATDVTAFYFNQKGNLQTQFKSPHMLHYIAQNKTDFISPHFWIYGKSPVPWHIFSQKGQATMGIDSIVLWDNVRVHQDSYKNQHEVNLQTSSMTLHPKIQTAETDQAVILNQPGYQISAIGVRLSLKDEQVNLLSEAKGQFMPNFLKRPVSTTIASSATCKSRDSLALAKENSEKLAKKLTDIPAPISQG